MTEFLNTYGVPVLVAFIGNVGFSFLFNIHGQNIIWASLSGAIAWLVYLMTESVIPSDISRTFLAAIVLAIFCEILARVRKAPVIGFLLISIFPLVPGAGIYYTMQYAIAGDIDTFLTSFLHTIGIAGALAVGITIVSTVVQLWTKPPRSLLKTPAGEQLCGKEEQG